MSDVAWMILLVVQGVVCFALGWFARMTGERQRYLAFKNRVVEHMARRHDGEPSEGVSVVMNLALALLIRAGGTAFVGFREVPLGHWNIDVRRHGDGHTFTLKEQGAGHA